MALAGKASPPNPRQRLFFFAAILGLWLLVICARLVYLQIFHYGEYMQRAQRQQQRSIDVAARRGVIYDRNGNELAMSVTVDSVFAVPSEIHDPAGTAAQLAAILQEDPQEIFTRIESSHAFCWIARKLDADTAARLRALNLKGVYFQKEAKRFYPKRELAAQVLGAVGMDDEGLAGIERSYDSPLRGKPGRMIISMDARRHWFGNLERQPEPGDNLVLTLDEKIQYIAERELENAMRSTRAQAGTVIIQNPRTGEVLALANRPTFNPNALGKADAQALNDRAVSDVYEPGSTFKIVTIAAALEEKLTTPEEVIDCQMGSIDIAGHTLHDHEPFGNITVAHVLADSSDVGAIKLGLRLGDERFDQYIRAFGFGRQTGIELPGETRGIAKPVGRWSKISVGAISMGQEIGVSALQLISMITTIANDGVYTAPRMVAGSVQGSPEQGFLQQVVFHPADAHRVISTLTAAEMKKMLEGVVLFGTGRRALLEGYTSAGKTGTAQKADPATGAYSRTQYIASFAGFAPVNNPAVAIAVILDSPVGSHEGGAIAAPVFARIAQQTLAYMNVPHDAEISGQRRLLLRAAAKASDDEISDSASGRLADAPLLAEVEPQSAAPDAPVTSSAGATPHVQPVAWKSAAQAHSASTDTAPKTAPPPLTDPNPAPAAPQQGGTVIVDIGGGVTVPSLLGLPVRAALEAAQQNGLELEIVGSGVARQQSPPPGSHIAAGGRVAVRFGH